MSSPYVKLGICKTQFQPLVACGGAMDPDTPGLVYCGATNIDQNPVLTEGFEASDPSGIPNRDCVSFDIPPKLDYFEIVLTTCSLYDPRLDALFGYSDLIELADGTCIGSMAKAKSGEDCLCECGTESCVERIGLVIWSLALCPDGSRHPDGQYAITVFPALQFRPNTDTITLNAELNGRQYLARAYENPDFGQGPGDIIPAEVAAFNRCRYEFLSDVCPPGGCDCGTCGGDPIAPLPVAERQVQRQAAPAAPARPAVAAPSDEG